MGHDSIRIYVAFSNTTYPNSQMPLMSQYILIVLLIER